MESLSDFIVGFAFLGFGVGLGVKWLGVREIKKLVGV